MEPSAIKLPRESERYVSDVCGVSVTEVSNFVLPAPSAEPLTADEHERLLTMARAARGEGQSWRAHTLAEQAYSGHRVLSTLLFLVDIRVKDLDEVAFGVAAYHVALQAPLT